MLIFNARGCTTLAVLDLKLSETEEAAVELAEYAAGMSDALLLLKASSLGRIHWI
jgi:hypothetical protein